MMIANRAEAQNYLLELGNGLKFYFLILVSWLYH